MYIGTLAELLVIVRKVFVQRVARRILHRPYGTSSYIGGKGNWEATGKHLNIDTRDFASINLFLERDSPVAKRNALLIES